MAILLSITNTDLDQTDLLLLERLLRHGRATWADLAEELGLTAPAIAQRVRRLEEKGVIAGYAARVSAEVLAPICAFLFAGADAKTIKRLLEMDAVMETHFLGGSEGWIVKVRCATLGDLDRLVSDTLTKAGLSIREVRVVLRTEKETSAVPLGNG